MWKIYFILILFIKDNSAQDRAEISRTILPEIKNIGATARLNCTVARLSSISTVHWIFANQRLTISSGSRITNIENLNLVTDGMRKYEISIDKKGDTATFTLIIRKLQSTDAGNYTCHVSIDDGNDINDPRSTGQLIVMSPPEIVISKTSKTTTVDEFSSVTLYCEAEGLPKPNITWARPNGRPIYFEKNINIHRSNHLKFEKINRRSTGVYRCIADNRLRPIAFFDISLYVNFAPVTWPVQTTYGQAPNRQFQLILECIVEGHPDPEINWYRLEGKERRLIRDDYRHEVDVSRSQMGIAAFWNQLTIENVNGEDFGYYYCEAHNQYGRHSSQIKIYETSECQGSNCPAEGTAG